MIVAHKYDDLVFSESVCKENPAFAYLYSLIRAAAAASLYTWTF